MEKGRKNIHRKEAVLDLDENKNNTKARSAYTYIESQMPGMLQFNVLRK